MIWLLLIPIVAVVVYLHWPRREPLAPMPPVTDTARHGFDQGRLTQPYDWTTDDGPDAA